MTAWRIESESSSLSGVCRCGETITFSLMVFRNDSPDWGNVVEYTVNQGWRLPLLHGELVLRPGENVLPITPVKPGCVQCTFTRRENGAAVCSTTLGILVEPGRIQAHYDLPDDYDDFWIRMRKTASPWTGSLVFSPTSTGLLHGILPGFPVEAWMPADAREHSLPAVLEFHGAGVRSPGYARGPAWAQRGYLSIEIAAHQLPVFEMPEFYNEKLSGSLHEYHRIGLMGELPEQCYFTQMLVRASLAADFACTIPQWDQKNLLTTGGSQGGWQALAAAALNPRVSATGVWIPAGCNILEGNWPCCGPREMEQPREKAYQRILPYIDTANFAKKIRCTVGIYAGLADPVCHPDAVFAAFNSLPDSISKEIHFYPRMPHEDNPIAMQDVSQFLVRNTH